MAIELAQRLISGEALPRRVVEAALLRHVKERVPFVSSLLELYPQHASSLLRELDLSGAPLAGDLSPDPHLMERLPVGLCSRLMGFPIGITSSSGVVDVLIVDPDDAHALAEFGFHLGTDVRFVRGRLAHIAKEVAAVEGLVGPRTARQDNRRMNDRDPLSAPPIPLTRVAAAEIQPGTHRGVAPPAAVGRVGQARGQSHTRSTVPPHPPQAASNEPAPASRSSVFPHGSDDLQTALSNLAVAEDGDAVVEALIVGLAGLSKEVVVFAVRGASFRSRGRTDLLSRPRRDATVELPPGENSLTQSLELGQYLGPLNDDSPELRFLAEHYDEVCVTRVDVMNRPALVVFAGGFSSPYDVSLRSDHLARAASDALARLVISRKR